MCCYGRESLAIVVLVKLTEATCFKSYLDAF
ncbi:hypothetical protein Vi05172_g11561 [Venturia inaequalis]|nr:hypothetical protein Vi05172_g11561 [Venturia inaequalis]